MKSPKLKERKGLLLFSFYFLIGINVITAQNASSVSTDSSELFFRESAKETGKAEKRKSHRKQSARNDVEDNFQIVQSTHNSREATDQFTAFQASIIFEPAPFEDMNGQVLYYYRPECMGEK